MNPSSPDSAPATVEGLMAMVSEFGQLRENCGGSAAMFDSVHARRTGIEAAELETEIRAYASRLCASQQCAAPRTQTDEIRSGAHADLDLVAREALATPAGVTGTVPAGYKLVPVEPTEEMAYRGGEATAGRIEWDDAPDDAPDQLARAIYRAMLNAAPAGVTPCVPTNRPATMEEAQHAAQIGACLPNGVLFDAFGRQRERYVRVTLDGAHLILHPSELEAWKADEENPDQFTYSDVYLSEEEADALPEFDGF